MTLSTHVLDTGSGRPVAALPVQVLRYADGSWSSAAIAETDADGRVEELLGAGSWAAGRWRIVFDVAAVRGPDAFFPTITLEVAVPDDSHYHAALLLSSFAYTTYRGS